MERKNTVLLTVIAVATLLVAVVGATFAYFTATNENGTITGANTGDVTTAQLGDTTFTFQGKSLDKSYLDYPGGLAVFGSKATLVKSGNDKNNYTVNFDLEIEYENQTQTDLYWALYMVENDNLDPSLDPECKIKTNVGADGTHFWYANQDDEATDETKSCTLTSTQKETLQQTTMIAYGTFKKGQEGKKKIDTSSEVSTSEPVGNETSPKTCQEELCSPNAENNKPLTGRTLSTSEDASKTKTYYLVVQYPNKPSDQSSTDENKPISVNLGVNSETIKVVANGAQGSQTTK